MKFNRAIYLSLDILCLPPLGLKLKESSIFHEQITKKHKIFNKYTA